MKKKPELKIYESTEALAVAFSQYFSDICKELEKSQEKINICLSGGNTPRYIFSHLVQEYAQKINWNKIHFYWGDERCVGPGHIDSNYGMTKSHLLDIVEIPAANIHFIDGSKNPESEAKRYAEELKKNIVLVNNIPKFDLIILGMGEDGHIASFFPEYMDLITSDALTAVTEHPLSKKPRMTITPKVINNAKHVAFLITGKNKADIVNAIYNNAKESKKYPAAHIVPTEGKYYWFLDREAAHLIKEG